MNRAEATARLEALLTRVIARKDAPRVPRAVVQPASPAREPVKALEPVKAPEIAKAVEPVKAPELAKAPEPVKAVEPESSHLASDPDLSVHAPLGDTGAGPEIDLFEERTMDLDLHALEAASQGETSLAANTVVWTPEPAPKPVAKPEPVMVEPPPAPKPVAALSAEPVVAKVAEPVTAREPEPVKAPEPVKVVEPAKVPEVAKVVEPAKVPEVAKAAVPERFEAPAIDAEAARVDVVAMPAPAARPLRELLERSLSLRVRGR